MEKNTLFTEQQVNIINEYISNIEKDIDIGAFKKIKTILNSSFTDARNQIIKPTLESIESALIEKGFFKRNLQNVENTYKEAEYTQRFIIWVRDQIPKQFDISVYIYFPDITISNSHKQSHHIKDLYVNFTLDPKGKIKSSLTGVRTSLTKQEANAGYLHSHLSSRNVSDDRKIPFHQFCLGEGQITQIISLLRQEFSEVNFTLFCLHLKQYVAWESLEGNPYISIDTLKLRNNQRIRGFSISEVSFVVERIIYDLIDCEGNNLIKMLGFSVTNKGISISPTDMFEVLVGRSICKNISTIRSLRFNSINELLVHKDSLEKYYPIQDNSSNTNFDIRKISKKPILKFKGEDKILNIIEDEKKENENEIKKEKYANRQFTDEICKRLSKEFNKTIFTSQIAIN